MKTPYLHTLPPRLANALKRLQALVWTIDTKPIGIAGASATDQHSRFDEKPSQLTQIDEFPHYWGRSFQQRWFQLALNPQDLGDFTHLCWRDRGEATLYLDGMPVGGFDPGHYYVPLRKEFSSVWIESICCRTGIWVDNEAQGIDDKGSRLEGAFLARRNAEAWEAMQDFAVLFDLATYLAQADRSLAHPTRFTASMHYRETWHTLDPRVRILVQGLDGAVDAFDQGGAAAMLPILKGLFSRMRGALPEIRATVIGHAHLDLVWLWPERVGEAKALHTFSTVLRLMEKYPDFIFTFSQPASYRAIETRSPALMAEVRKRIADGRWEATGAMEVESDTNMACGEALARSFLLGQKEFVRLTGKPSQVVWLPDVFGYSACLPQIMSEVGASYFYTTKLAWSTSTRFPFTSFRWRGHDGSEIIAHVMSNDQGYNRTGHVSDIVEPLRAHREIGVHPEVLIPIGYGDGGGGPSEDVCERVQRYGDLSGLPATQWGRIDKFFDRLAGLSPQLPVWDGEIYLEYHRGVFTTHVEVKQTFRELERALQVLEAVHCVTGAGGIDTRFWQRLVFSQFHDYIPGSSVLEVYVEGVSEQRGLIAEARGLAQQALTPGNVGASAGWFNPLAMELHWVSSGGQALTIPPLAFTSKEQAVTGTGSCRVDAASISNQRVRATFDSCGRVVGLWFDGKQIAQNGPLNEFRVCPDHPAQFEAWDIDRNTAANPLKLEETASFEGVQQREAWAEVSFLRKLTEKSHVRVIYRLEEGQAELRIRYEVEWGDSEMLLQALFPTGYTGTHACYGAPFGSVRRPQKDCQLSADAQFEVPASRWAVVGDEGEHEALALIAKDRYGFGCRDGLLHCTLVRSALITDQHLNRPLRQHEYPHDHSDLGSHVFDMALAWGGMDVPRGEQPAALAERLYVEPLEVAAPPRASGFLGLEGGETVVPSWAKPAESGEGWILRLHETRGQRGTVKIKLAEGWKATRTCLSETTSEPMADAKVPFLPYSLLSIRIQPV
ncbi:MAG: alpha-mannosidase [Verrucomicrobiales bacterium]